MEPDNSLSMGDEHLRTIPETESDEVIKSGVENLVPIPSEFEGISDDTYDVPVRDDYSTLDALNDNSEILSNSIDLLPPFPIPVADSDSFLRCSDSSLSHLDNSLPEFETFSDLRKRREVAVPLSFESFHFDPSFPRPPPKPPDVEICLYFEPDAPVIDNFNELNDDQRGSEIDFSEDDDSFTFVIRTFLPFLTYPEVSPLSCSTGSEDTIFDPGIST
ncbi:hypothetical protein Tco_1282210 [Tanacetum coccineum]